MNILQMSSVFSFAARHSLDDRSYLYCDGLNRKHASVEMEGWGPVMATGNEIPIM